MGQDNGKLQQWGDSAKAGDLGFRKGYTREEFRTGLDKWQWYTLNIGVPLKFLCWNLIPRAMVWGGGTSGRWLGHKGGASWMGLVPLLERPQRAPSSCLPCEDTARRQLFMNQEVLTRQSAGTLILGLPSARTVRNKSLLFTTVFYYTELRQATNKDRKVFNVKTIFLFFSFLFFFLSFLSF